MMPDSRSLASSTRTTTLTVPHTTIESIERRLRNLRKLQGAIARAQQGLQAGLTLAAQEFEALDALLGALKGQGESDANGH